MTHGESIEHARMNFDRLSSGLVKNFLIDKVISGPFSAEWQRLFMTMACSYMAIRFHETFLLMKMPSNWDFVINVLGSWFHFPKGSEKLIGDLIHNNDKMNRRSFVLNFMFEVEQFVKSINSKLDNPSTETKYGELIKHVLKSLSIEDYNKKLDAMKASSLARNVLHDGGVHKTDDDNVTVQNKNYKFIKGEEIDWLTWKVLLIFSEELIKVLEELDSKLR